ncbi:kinase-like domain-containing protein [Mycotypha africana]|uniref:kinase-like domain-containing protein n=1 Tax=Mycotypha africana TaxID=64632 RepID=UPI0023005567|nr:kinase-like domain-containing protein [Mycotypha africana]KAI8982329.1 kinase-like domain-containing protein [Mycotypha africana]
MDPQQQAAASAAWSSFYGYTVTDYNTTYGTNYTQEEYQQYIQQYYQTQHQDPNNYYSYYDSAYYQQAQQQAIPQNTTTSTTTTTTTTTTANAAATSVIDHPTITHTTTPAINTVNTSLASATTSSKGKDSDKVLKEIGYPYQTQEDPSILYEKIGQVGEGTYGKVYKARNCKTGSLMALKRIRMESKKDGFPITAMREIKLLQKLKHERIVELQEVMVAKGSVYMVLEYMDHDLSGILGHPEFKFEPEHTKSLVKQMLEGLAYLHDMGILHRDIKGSNLLLNNEGELKIADFGLARVFEKSRSHDYTNRVITLWYRPPELLLGATAYGPAVDIWSVGCIMLEFFTGRAIFNGTDEVSQLECIYKIMGTPTEENWPTVRSLPWFEMVRPNKTYESKFRDTYEALLSPGALELAEALLSLDPIKRPTAADALNFKYFKEEGPKPIKPANLLSVQGDWHEFESKQRRRQKNSSSNIPYKPHNHVGHKQRSAASSSNARPAPH